jgi:parallel beta-helix repeat protein
MERRAPRKLRTRLAVERLEGRDLPSTYFVATNGSDGGAGSSAAPWRTLQHAVDSVKPGDVIEVETGTYAGCRIGNSGTASAPITLEAAPGAAVTVNAPGASNKHGSDIEVENFSGTVSYWTIQGLTVQNAPTNAGIDIRVTSHITVQNCTCTGNNNWGIFLAFSDYPVIQNNVCANSKNQHGIYDSNSGDYPTITGNTVYGNKDCGIELNGDVSQGGDGIITGAVITRNIVYNNGSAGGAAINCDGVQGSLIENNLLYNNFASGIALFQIDGGGPSSGNLVENNTVVMASSKSRWALTITNGSTGNTVLTNILLTTYAGQGAITIDSASLVGFKSDYNIVVSAFNTGGSNLSLSQWQAQTGQDSHSFVATSAQLFVNPAKGDYHLSATSPAIDKGTSTTAPPIDLDGNPRPYGKGYDIGCYEWQGKVLAVATGSSVAPGLPAVANGSTGNTALNNSLPAANAGQGAIIIDASSLAGFTSDSNLVSGSFSAGGSALSLSPWQAPTGPDGHAFPATPAQLFVNPARGDYQLSATRPAIDVDTFASAPVGDPDGNPQPYVTGFGIGGYEWQGYVL